MSKTAGIKHNDYWTSVDFDAIAAVPDEGLTHFLIGTDDQRWVSDSVCVTYNGKPPGSRSPANFEFHDHPQDQIFYILSGEMMIEIEGKEPFKVQKGDVVIYPTGTMHRSWVVGPEKVFHLQINGNGLV